jgi:hypothetical protein
VVERPDTLRNFHIPPAHAGYTRRRGCSSNTGEGA